MDSSGLAGGDVLSLVLSLGVVLAVIYVLAALVKRMNFKFQQQGSMKVMGNLSLGPKERLVIVEVGQQQLLLGVTSHSIHLIKELPEPLVLKQPPSSVTS